MAERSSNHGEGNPEAADRFNKSEQQFVNSPRGKSKIAQAGEVRAEEESELAKAERQGREHSKGEDAVDRMKE